MNSAKNWEDLTPKEQEEKLYAIGDLLQANDLAQIKPKVLDQIVY